MTHDFRERLRAAADWEERIYRFYREWWWIQPATRMPLQRAPAHIDSIWIRKSDPNVRWLVEVTVDERACDTGNLFVETLSRDRDREPGKYNSTIADRVLIYLPGPNTVLWYDRQELQSLLVLWANTYPIGEAQNDGYKTMGALVPVGIAQRSADKVVVLPEQWEAA